MTYLQHFLALLFACTVWSTSFSQAQYQVIGIGFYNFENYFDLEDDPVKRDEDFTPGGRNVYTAEVFKEKTDHLARVVHDLAKDLTPDGLAILGVSEIENRAVLEHLVKHPKIASRNYQIVHYESPDFRGIDVALLYQEKYYTVTSSRAIPLIFYRPDSSRSFTRDILLVSGQLHTGEPLHVLVNHWPSRRGGEKATAPYRNAAAARCKAVSDSILAANPLAKVIIMGDLNDDPVSPSVKNVIAAEGKKKKVKPGGYYNPMLAFYKKGIGTTAWRDAWSLFDQIILSHSTLEADANQYRYYKSSIFNPKYLVQASGQYKGYPFRTYGGGAYMGGYSDHFPVYVVLVRELQAASP